MIQITKAEAMYLQDKGFAFGETLHSTHSRWKHYYLTPTAKAMRVLNNYRKNTVNN